MDLRRNGLEDSTIYHIKIEGQLREKWIDWLNGMVMEIKGDECFRCTTIKLTVSDQAALRGILNKLWDLNLTLISIIRTEVTKG